MKAIYVSRVESRDGDFAVFHEHPLPVDEEWDAQVCRRHYRAFELSLSDEGENVRGPNWYVLTGVPFGLRTADLFFVAPSDHAAKDLAVKQEWAACRLYRCEECAP